MRILFFFILIITIFGFFAVGRALYHEDNTVDIQNLTESLLVWNSSYFDEQTNVNVLDHNYSLGVINSIRLKKIIFKTLDTTGYITFEFGKWGVETGYNRPEWDYLFWAKMIIILLAIIICLPLMPIIIFSPIIIWVLIKEYKIRKEEKL